VDSPLPLTAHQPVEQARSRKRSTAVRAYVLAIVLPVVGFLVFSAVTELDLRQELRSGAPWIIALFLVELFPLPVWREIRLSLGYPVIMLLAVLYTPAAVALFVLLGAGDPKEFNGDWDLLRTAFNRSQVALAAFTASTVFHAFAPDRRLGPAVLAVGAVASATHLAVNMLSVGVAAKLDYRVPFREVFRRMLIGGSWAFEVAYAGLGVLGIVVALVYLQVGTWAVVGLLPPLISMRYMLKAVGELQRAHATLERDAALQDVADQLAAERHQERQRLAATLHDDLNPLLVSAGLRLDTVLARLDAVDHAAAEQIRTALAADRAAQATVRSLIGELLQSPTGPNGVSEGLRPLLSLLASRHGLAIRHYLEPIEAPATVNELLFGMAREAVRNAVTHGRAHLVEVSLREIEDVAVLTVADDGRGFEAERLGDDGQHYGLRILRERAEACGGRFTVVSEPGSGTVVIGEIPLTPEATLQDTPPLDLARGPDGKVHLAL